MSTAPDRLVEVLADRYRIERELGRGGMATVYLAQDLRHDRQVAIKFLHEDLGASLGPERFLAEIKTTAKLQHAHILPLLDSGDAGGLLFYVMPYVDGETLRDRLKRETQLPVEEAVRIARDVADALSYAHAHGIIHRDIKPENILLGVGNAIVADFGIARAMSALGPDRLTQTGISLGTPAYMSPEQGAGEDLDGRSDVYALGCVLYESLAGTPPFTGPNARAIMARHALDAVPSVRTIRNPVPQALESVIMRALAKLPTDRHATAAEFRDEIVRAATMPVTADETARTVQRRLVKHGVAAAALGVALLLTAGIWRLRHLPPSLDANRVMVFPFLLPADWSGSRTAGEDVATVIGSAMDGAGLLRWVDGWQLLQPAQRENIRLLAVSEAMSIARANRCAFAVTGRLISRGDSADVFLELHDVRGDSVLARPRGEPARATESWIGALRSVTNILPTLIPTATPDVEAEWKARPPRAVAYFLLGEAAFRRLRLKEALAAFSEAVVVDSTFGVAAVRGAQVASWAHDEAAVGSLIRAAQRSTLSPRYTFFARGLAAFHDGQADSAIVQLRAAIALDSSMTTAWVQLGEVYMHLLPSEGNADSLGETAFARAHALDSTAAGPMFHLVEIMTRRGDWTGAAAAARSFLKVAVDTMLVREVELIVACRNRGFEGVNLREAVMHRPQATSAGAKMISSRPALWNCAQAAYEMLLREDTSKTDAADGRRFFALMGLTNVLYGRGRTTDAVNEISKFHGRWGYGLSLYLLAAPVIPGVAERAREVARQDSAKWGPNYERLETSVRLWELGVWAAVEGRKQTATTVADSLAARGIRGSRIDSLMASSMAAHAALAQEDSALALTRFQDLIAHAAPLKGDVLWLEPAALGFDRLVLARLLILRRDYAGAQRVLEVFDSAVPAVYPLYQRASLSLRIEAAVALKQRALAASLRNRLEGLAGH